MAELLIRCPDQPDQVLTLSAKPVWIGRSEDCAVPLWDEAASRRHALLEERPDGLYLVDLGSANGTWFVGDPEQRILRRVVVLGDTLRIGDTTIRFVASLRYSAMDNPSAASCASKASPPRPP